VTTEQRNERWLGIVLLALAPLAAAALAASFAWSVDEMAAGAPWRLVGLAPAACPGCAACGLSRAFTALSHGDVALAVRFHAGVLVLYPASWLLAVAGPALALTRLARGRSARRLPDRPRGSADRSSTCRPLPS
jgi:hypothetical protein